MHVACPGCATELNLISEAATAVKVRCPSCGVQCVVPPAPPQQPESLREQWRTAGGFPVTSPVPHGVTATRRKRVSLSAMFIFAASSVACIVLGGFFAFWFFGTGDAGNTQRLNPPAEDSNEAAPLRKAPVVETNGARQTRIASKATPLAPSAPLESVAAPAERAPRLELTTKESKPKETPTTVLRGHTSRVRALEFSPDGRWLASASVAELAIWDTRSRRLHRFCGEPPVKPEVADRIALSFSARGEFLAEAIETSGIAAYRSQLGLSKVIRLWDLRSGIRTCQLSASLDQINSVHGAPRPLLATSRMSFFRGKDQFAFVTPEGNIRVVEAGTGSEVTTLIANDMTEGRGGSLLFTVSPDDRLLAASFGTADVLLWKLDEPRREPTQFASATGSLDGLVFSPDSKRLLALGVGATVWEVAGGDKPTVLATFAVPKRSGAFAGNLPDGKSVLIESERQVSLLDWTTLRWRFSEAVPATHHGILEFDTRRGWLINATNSGIVELIRPPHFVADAPFSTSGVRLLRVSPVDDLIAAVPGKAAKPVSAWRSGPSAAWDDSATSGTEIKLLDLTTHRPAIAAARRLQRKGVADRDVKPNNVRVADVAVSSGGLVSLVENAAGSRWLRCWNEKTPTPLRATEITDGRSRVRDDRILLSRDGATVCVVTEDGQNRPDGGGYIAHWQRVDDASAITKRVVLSPKRLVSPGIRGRNPRAGTTREIYLFPLALSDDGKQIVFSRRMASDVTRGETIHTLEVMPLAGARNARPLAETVVKSNQSLGIVARFSADGNSLAVARLGMGVSGESAQVAVYDLRKGNDSESELFACKSRSAELGWSPDGRYLQLTLDRGSFLNRSGSALYVFSVDDAAIRILPTSPFLFAPMPGTNPPRSLFLADGEHLVTLDSTSENREPTLVAWHLASGQRAWTQSAEFVSGGVRQFVLSPCGRVVALAGYSHVYLVDPVTGEMRTTFAAHANPFVDLSPGDRMISAIHFSCDSRKLLTIGAEGALFLVATGLDTDAGVAGFGAIPPGIP